MSAPVENRSGGPPRVSPSSHWAGVPTGDAFGALIGGLTHDFNNLFGLIIGNLELLRDPQTTAEESKDFSRDALEAAMRGAELTRDLIAFAQRQRLDPQAIDLNALVTATVQARGARLGKHIEIVLDLAHDLWPAVADAAQLEAALATLITGAAEAMAQAGRIEVATANCKVEGKTELSPGDYATIMVTDGGPGIPAEQIGRVFEPFAAKGRMRGTGLRLGAILGFMRQSRGHMTVKSSASTGATFTLYLPRSGATGESEGRHPSRADGKSKTVLVVEDDSAMRQLAVRHLTALGYGVVEAANAAVAIAMLETEPAIDLLFTDVIMPGEMDGLALASMVVRRWSKVKIVVTSEVAVTRIGRGDLGTGICLLPKPYSKDDLTRTLHKVLHPGGGGAAYSSA